MHTGNKPDVKLINWNEKTQKGGEGENRDSSAIPIEKVQI